MSDKPISVGDLVMVVRWPCCGLILGYIARVSNIDHMRGTYCVECRRVYNNEPNADFFYQGPGSLACAPLSCLKRIDPDLLKETESTELTLRINSLTSSLSATPHSEAICKDPTDFF